MCKIFGTCVVACAVVYEHAHTLHVNTRVCVCVCVCACVRACVYMIHAVYDQLKVSDASVPTQVPTLYSLILA